MHTRKKDKQPEVPVTYIIWYYIIDLFLYEYCDHECDAPLILRTACPLFDDITICDECAVRVMGKWEWMAWHVHNALMDDDHWSDSIKTFKLVPVVKANK